MSGILIFVLAISLVAVSLVAAGLSGRVAQLEVRVTELENIFK